MVDWAGTVVATTPRLVLRTFREDDLPVYAALNADPAVVRFLGGSPLRREFSRCHHRLGSGIVRTAGFRPAGGFPRSTTGPGTAGRVPRRFCARPEDRGGPDEPALPGVEVAPARAHRTGTGRAGGTATGKNNAAVARSLFLSDRAVEKHIGVVFQKLGLIDDGEVNRRVKAVLAFLEASGPHA
ncbi:MAG TPA: LuxR C-terminal-related transcriptional regulator [Nakamurella sp.]|nr:LuxR C-terminal-related transcriptional regulator [Nakamurella sp.]